VGVEPEASGAELGRLPRGTDGDRMLLAAIAAGDQEGLRALLERHGSGLLAYVSGLVGDPRLAEEVLQDTLLAVWRGAAGFVGGSTVRTWLYAVGRRRAVDALRRRGVRLVGEDHEDDGLAGLPDIGPGPEVAVLARADLERVAGAITRLAPLHREVLLLVCVYELTGAEISAVLGIPVGTVKSRLSHARRALSRLVATGEVGEEGESDG
jgi:RNA polymerase sigma factor (sigma-70 family)